MFKHSSLLLFGSRGLIYSASLWTNVGLMLGHRLRLWASINPAMVQHVLSEMKHVVEKWGRTLYYLGELRCMAHQARLPPPPVRCLMPPHASTPKALTLSKLKYFCINHGDQWILSTIINVLVLAPLHLDTYRMVHGRTEQTPSQAR